MAIFLALKAVFDRMNLLETISQVWFQKSCPSTLLARFKNFISYSIKK